MDIGTPAPEKLKLILQELRQRLEELYGNRLAQLVLYGSQARGDAEHGSDIDVLVVLRGAVSPGDEIDRTSELASELSLKYGEDVSRFFVTEDTFRRCDSPLLLTIRREGVAV